MNKTLMVLGLAAAFVLTGCGKNPLIGLLGSPFSVGVGRMDSLSLSGAPSYKAHNSDTPDDLVMTINLICAYRDDGAVINIWSGSQEVDLSKITSLSQVSAFQGSIPPGKYTRLQLQSNNLTFKVKGSVVMNGVTYYTKTAHANWTNPPAEYEELNIAGLNNCKYSIDRIFDPAIELGKATSVSDAYLLIDTEFYLTYYDGDPSTSPGWGKDWIFSQTGPGMYIASPLSYAVTIGKPAKKEVYTYSCPGHPGSGMIVLLFDGNDNPIGGSVKQLLVNNDGAQFEFWGSFGDNCFITEPSFTQKNSDGTLTLKMERTGGGSSFIVNFPNFSRASHTGSLNIVNTGTGTYNATYIATRTY